MYYQLVFTWLSRHLLSSCSRVGTWACTYTQETTTHKQDVGWTSFKSISKCLWQQCKEDAVVWYVRSFNSNTLLPGNMTHKQLSSSGAFNQWRGRGQHTVRVHLHHDHRDCLVADPDDPGASLSLSSLLIGRGNLWGWGLSLTCLLRLVGWVGGRGVSLSAVSCSSHCGTQVHLSVKMQAPSARSH